MLSIFLRGSQTSCMHPDHWILLKYTHGALSLTTAAASSKVQGTMHWLIPISCLKTGVSLLWLFI